VSIIPALTVVPNMTEFEIIQGFQCPRCGWMSIAKGKFHKKVIFPTEGDPSVVKELNTIYKYRCLHCGCLFCKIENFFSDPFGEGDDEEC